LYWDKELLNRHVFWLQLRAEKRAERERIKQASLDEKKRITEEREKACADIM
jgi:hypothetical protein